MLTNKQIEMLPAKMTARIEGLNVLVLKQIAEKIKKIGKMNASQVNSLSRLGALDADLDEIKKKIAFTTKKNIKEIDQIFEIAKKEHYDFAAEYFKEQGKKPDMSFLSEYVESVKKATKNSFINISKTTGFEVDGKYKGIKEAYKDVIDKAIYEVTNGVTDYKTAIRDALKALAESGLKAVEYTSGKTRKLESALKMNVLDGIREVNAGMSERSGKRFGADGVEISVHANSAPDHEDIQGHQFTHEEFEKMQTQKPFKDINGKYYKAIQRPIGMWNCGHYTFEIVTGAAKPAYSEKELKAYKARNNKGFVFEDVKYTGYQAEQMLNTLKNIWYKHNAIYETGLSADDPVMWAVYGKKKSITEHLYRKFSKAAGLFNSAPWDFDITDEIEEIKDNEPKKEIIEKDLTKEVKNDKIHIEKGPFEKAYGKQHSDAMVNIIAGASDDTIDEIAVWNKYVGGLAVASKDIRTNPVMINGKPRSSAFQLENKLYTDLESDIKGDAGRVPYMVSFHESGHGIDYLAGDGNYISHTYKNGAFAKMLRKEAKAYLESRAGEDGYVGMLNAAYKLKKSFWETRETERAQGKSTTIHAVSDIFSGAAIAARVEVKWPFFHDSKYWRSSGSLATEAFTHMFSTTIADPAALAKIIEYFPESHKIYLEIIKMIK